MGKSSCPRILVTRSRTQAGSLSKQLVAIGAEPVEVPLIRIEDPADWESLDQAIRQIDTFDWLIFTSANAVEKFFSRFHSIHKTPSRLLSCRIAVVGSTTAKQLKKNSLTPDYQPEKFDADALVKGMGDNYDMHQLRVLFPGADIARETVVKGLSELGASVTPVVAYRTVRATSLPASILTMLQANAIQMITFASSSSVEAFVHAVPQGQLDALMTNVLVACIGPVTANTAREAGLSVDIIPEEATIPAFVEAIEKMI